MRESAEDMSRVALVGARGSGKSSFFGKYLVMSAAGKTGYILQASRSYSNESYENAGRQLEYMQDRIGRGYFVEPTGQTDLLIYDVYSRNDSESVAELTYLEAPGGCYENKNDADCNKGIVESMKVTGYAEADNQRKAVIDQGKYTITHYLAESHVILFIVSKNLQLNKIVERMQLLYEARHRLNQHFIIVLPFADKHFIPLKASHNLPDNRSAWTPQHQATFDDALAKVYLGNDYKNMIAATRLMNWQLASVSIVGFNNPLLGMGKQTSTTSKLPGRSARVDNEPKPDFDPNHPEYGVKDIFDKAIKLATLNIDIETHRQF